MSVGGLETQLRGVLERTGCLEWLSQMRLRAPLGAAWRAIKRPATLRDQLDILRDYRTFRAECGPVVGPGRHLADGSRRVMVVSLSDWICQVKIEALLAKALQVRGYTPVIVTHSDAGWAQRYYRLFGYGQFVRFDRAIAQVPAEAVAAHAETLLARATSIQAIKKFQYRGVNVGRQVLATITRSLHASTDVTAPDGLHRLKAALLQAMRSVLAAEHVVGEIAPSMALFLEKDYMGIGSLYDVCVNRGVNTMQWCLSHRDDSYTLKRFTPETRNLHPKSLSDDTWRLIRAMPWTPAREAALKEEFTLRYEQGKWASYYNRPYGQLKPADAIRQQLELDPSKKTAVVFSHVLWDSTFFWGEDLFDDYAEWLVETVRAACRNPAVNWIVKLHPANGWKLARENVRGELYDRLLLRDTVGTLPPHVKLLGPETDLNTYALFAVSDYCLTVRGTIGSEMACHGIPVLTAGTGRYSGLGFTIDSSSREEYLARLARIQDLPALDEEETMLAKKYAYAIFALRPWRATSFEGIYLPLRPGGHPLDHNVRLRLRSFRDLLSAPDLAAFAEWACRSEQADFLSSVPGSTAQDALAVARADRPLLES